MKDRTLLRSSRLLALSLLLSAAPSILSAQMPSYDDVIVVVNDRSAASVEIGNYFAARRNIAQDRICHINVDTVETIDSASFVSLKWQIQNWMNERNLVNSTNYIVTTKGCPLRVATSQQDIINVVYSGQSSFEDCLTLINGKDSVHMLTVKPGSRIPSRYYQMEQHFKRDVDRFPYYLVTRLDAYTVDQVKSIIHKAENPASAADGVFVIDIDPSKDGNAGYKILNDRMREAAKILRSRGLNVELNEDATYDHGAQGVIGYISWGTNDANISNLAVAHPGNTWLNGAITHAYVSFSGGSLNKGVVYGASQAPLVGDLINEGSSGGVGYTDEPYQRAMANPDVLFDRYTNGYNLAESFYAAYPNIAWRQVIIGDPKMTLKMSSSAAVASDKGASSSAIVSSYPNPCRDGSSIRYRVASAGRVKLEVVDLMGRTVRTLVDGTESAGEHAAAFDAAGLEAGTYVCRLTISSGTGSETCTHPLVLVR